MWVLEYDFRQNHRPRRLGTFASMSEAEGYAQRNPMKDQFGRTSGYTIYSLAPPVKGL